MKKLLSKVEVHPLTYIILFIMLHEGLIKYVFVISIILIIHELGHLLFMKIFKRKIVLIKIFPFGSLIKVDSVLSTNIYEDIIISLGGIIAQLVACVFINNDMFLYYNKLIILFNLLPICPLDGYRVLKNITELFLPYNKTFFVSFVISILFLSIIIIKKVDIIYYNLLIIIFMIYSTFKEYSLKKFYMFKFFYERKKYKVRFRRVVYISKKENMYKNRFNMINNIREDIYLQEEPLKYLLIHSK